MSVADFISRTKILVKKLNQQGFRLNKLRHVYEKFASNYYELLVKYNCPVGQICNSVVGTYDVKKFDFSSCNVCLKISNHH